MSGEQNTRDKLAAVIQETIQSDDSAKAAEVDGSLLTGWVVVAEWATPDDDFAITFRAGGAGGSTIPLWRAQGLMHYATTEMATPPSEDEED